MSRIVMLTVKIVACTIVLSAGAKLKDSPSMALLQASNASMMQLKHPQKSFFLKYFTFTIQHFLYTLGEPPPNSYLLH